MDTKRCTLCLKDKPLDEFYWANKKRTIKAARCKPCAKAVSVEYQRNNPDRRFINIKHYYGLTKDDWLQLFDSQNGGCAICGESAILCVDHDHTCCPGSKSCGRCVRGLLCHSCNNLLARSKENPETLRKAVDYLDRYSS